MNYTTTHFILKYKEQLTNSLCNIDFMLYVIMIVVIHVTVLIKISYQIQEYYYLNIYTG